jgi:hypothetical protein
VISAFFGPSVTKKPHIRLNAAGRLLPSAFLRALSALHGRQAFSGDIDINDIQGHK